MTKIVVLDAEELASLVETAVRRAVGTHADEWVDAKNSGLGRRTFLRLAREGAFPISKIGKRYVARRADIAKHVEQQRRVEGARRTTTVTSVSDRSERGAHAKASRDSDLGDPVAQALARGRLRVLKGPP